MQFCQNYRRVAWSHLDGGKAVIVRLRCGEWSCQYCAAKNQSIWRAFLLKQLPTLSDDWYLITLTAHSRLRTRGQSLANIRDNIDRLIKRLHRTFGEFEYVRVYEKHPTSDAIHAHLIISDLADYVVHGHYKNSQRGFVGVLERPYRLGCWSLLSYIKIVTQDCNMGYVAHGKALVGNPSFAVNYVCKYLTKDLQGIEEKGLRHVQTTRRIGSPSVAGVKKWQVGSVVTKWDFQPGEKLTDLNTGELMYPDDWDSWTMYPDLPGDDD